MVTTRVWGKMAKLTDIEFEGYKAFGVRQRLELRPLTVLFGHNSVGKSAALRLAKVLADAAGVGSEPRFGTTILDYTSAALRGASFEEITHNGQTGAGLAFSLTWDDGIRYEFSIRETGVRRNEAISHFVISSNTETQTFTNIDPSEGTFEYANDEAIWLFELQFDGICPVLDTVPDSLNVELLRVVSERLNQLGRSVHWISAIRSQPPRSFLLGPGTTLKIEPDGTGTAETLRASWINDSPVAGDVSNWLAKTCGCSLPFASTDGSVFQNREHFPFSVVPTDGGGEVAVRDVGEGISQALPVITLCRLAARGELGEGPVVLLEQPELHLHPKAGMALANGMIQCVEDGSPARHIVETHSESFLLAIQIAVLEKRIHINDVVVYWVSSGASGSNLTKIEFDEEGYPSDGWPDSVFRETLEQARRVGELRLKR